MSFSKKLMNSNVIEKLTEDLNNAFTITNQKKKITKDKIKVKDVLSDFHKLKSQINKNINNENTNFTSDDIRLLIDENSYTNDDRDMSSKEIVDYVLEAITSLLPQYKINSNNKIIGVNDDETIKSMDNISKNIGLISSGIFKVNNDNIKQDPPSEIAREISNFTPHFT